MRLFYSEFHIFKLSLASIFIAVYLAVLNIASGSLYGFFAVAATLVFYILLPGAVLARLQKPTCTATFVLYSFLWGAAFFTALYLLCLRLKIDSVLFILPLIIDVMLISTFEFKGLKENLQSKLVGFVKNPAFSTLTLFFSLIVVAKGLAFSLPNIANTSQSANILAAQAAAFKLTNFTNSIFIASASSHSINPIPAFIGVLSYMTKASTVEIAVQIFPLIILLVLFITLYSTANIFYKDQYKATMFTVSMFSLGGFGLYKILPKFADMSGEDFFTIALEDYGSFSVSVLLAFTILGVLTIVVRNNYRVNIASFIFFLLCFAVLCCLSFGIAAILCAAIFLSFLFHTFHYGLTLPPLFVAFASGSVLYCSNFYSYSHFLQYDIYYSSLAVLEGNSLFFLLRKAFVVSPALYYAALPLFIILSVFFLFPAFYLPFIKVLFFEMKRLFTLSQDKIAVLLTLLISLAGVFLLGNSPEHSFFLAIATLLACLYFIDGLFKIRYKITRLLVGILIFAVLTSTVNTYYVATKVGIAIASQLIKSLKIQSSKETNAMNFLQENTDINDVFAANISQNNALTALSERAAFFEPLPEIKAVELVGAKDLIAKKSALNEIIFNAALSPLQLLDFLRANDIDHVVYDKSTKGDLSSFYNLQLIYEDEFYILYSLK